MSYIAIIIIVDYDGCIFIFYNIGCCSMPLIDSSVIVEGHSIICAIDGSHITYHCQTGLVPNDMKTSICIGDGTWIPNPSDLVCTSTEGSNSSHPPII